MRNRRFIGPIVAIVLTLGTAAYAQSDHLKAGNTGHLTLTQETRVGNAFLAPGDYEVRHRRSTNGHFVEFTRVVGDAYGPGQTLSPYDWVVVAQVPCTMKSLRDPVTRTSLEGSKDGVATDLRIRGEKVEHVFPVGPDPSAPQNQVEYGGAGM